MSIHVTNPEALLAAGAFFFIAITLVVFMCNNPNPTENINSSGAIVLAAFVSVVGFATSLICALVR